MKDLQLCKSFIFHLNQLLIYTGYQTNVLYETPE